MTSRCATFLATALLSAACSRSPSPLTPNVIGTSIGAPSRGVLIGGVQLPASGPGYRWLSPAGHHYGLARLVRAIEGAAAEVARRSPGGRPLLVGDLSARAGGQLSGHASHRTGRDADLLFYAET